MTHDVAHGSFNAEMFNDFVENNLLPMCNPFPGSRSVIIVDNCRIHHNEVSELF